MEKANKFPSSHSTEDEIAQNSIANHFVEEKKNFELYNFVPNHSAEDKNARKSVPNHLAEEKNGRNFVPNHRKNFCKLVPSPLRGIF
jgi:hypothetical protein